MKPNYHKRSTYEALYRQLGGKDSTDKLSNRSLLYECNALLSQQNCIKFTRREIEKIGLLMNKDYIELV